MTPNSIIYWIDTIIDPNEIDDTIDACFEVFQLIVMLLNQLLEKSIETHF